MNFTTDPFQIPEDQQTPLVKWLLEIIRDNKQLIETQAKKIEELKIKVEVLDDELKKLKKLPPKPDIKKSTLNENPDDKKKVQIQNGQALTKKVRSWILRFMRSELFNQS